MRITAKSSSIPDNLDELAAIILSNRMITDVDEYYNPPHPTMIKPETVGFDTNQLSLAQELIARAIANKEHISIVGDYDADGVCATAVMWLTLRSLAADVKPFIPDREKHGYGLSKSVIDSILQTSNPTLLITVDNGIVAHDAVTYAQSKGIKVIVTDHHQIDGERSPADAVVHSTQLCGSSVSWMLCHVLTQHQQATAAPTKELLDLVGLATIADQVPLVAANRAFVVAGLKALRASKRPGIVALCAVSGVEQAQMTEGTIGYSIAPRINAAGRMGDATEALRLLCTSSDQVAVEKARLLQMMNTQRQELTNTLFQVAVQQAQQQLDLPIIIIELEDGVEGVIGLVAGKISQDFHKPAIAVSKSAHGFKGSARSVPGVNITALMRTAEDLLSSVGGHMLAGGFTSTLENWPAVVQRWRAAAAAIDVQLLTASVEVECYLPSHLCTIETVTFLNKFAPYGAGNPEPVFAIADMSINRWQTLGSDKQHLKIILNDSNQRYVDAMWWQAGKWADTLLTGQKVISVGRLSINRWNNREKLQLIIAGFHS